MSPIFDNFRPLFLLFYIAKLGSGFRMLLRLNMIRIQNPVVSSHGDMILCVCSGVDHHVPGRLPLHGGGQAQPLGQGTGTVPT